jgi:CheY-like chemotaxis protein
MKKILLVDDERIFHFLTSKIIEVSGINCEIQSAFDGKEALAKLSEGGYAPDFIFVDLDMPNINGFQFVETFKKNTLSASKIIVLSSSVTEQERTRVLALGADVYMSKPLTETDVKELLK